MADTEIPVRTYEIEFADGGAIRVDIPETWKVTYGPIIGPGSKGSGTAAFGGGNAFRAWENETKQRLLLTDVVRFRDIALPMFRRAVRKFGSETWMPDDGKWTGQKALEAQKSWLPIDQVDGQPDDDTNDADDPRAYSPKRLRGMSPRPDRSFTAGGSS